MRFLILGGNGYIGSKVVRLLVEAGHNVVCTKRENSDLSRLKDIRNQIEWISTSIDEIGLLLKSTSFDYVINMACNYGRANVLYEDVIEANIEFPLKVINRAVENGTRDFITLGTGLPDDFNMYTFSKKVFGNFGKFYVEKHHVNFTCLKLEMFYGADEPMDRFVPSVIRKMINGKDVKTTLGTQKRDIVSSEDVVKAIMMVINVNPKGYNEIDVGTGVCPSVGELVDFIWEETGRKSVIHKGEIPMRPDEPDCVANIEKLRELGDWNPVEWKTGISKMIQDMMGVMK